MARITTEDSLKYIKNANHFDLINTAIKLAQSAPPNIKHKPAVWALKLIAEGNYKIPEQQ